jgi:histidyl-tRNA synthetase
VHQGEAAGRYAFRVAEALRSAGFAIHLHCGGGSFKSQMKKADGSGAPVALIVGDDETAANAVSVKLLRSGFDQPPAQVRVSFDELAEHLGDILFPMEDDNGNL